MVPAIELAVPFVHMNGDRKETLLENLENSYAAVNAAIDALCQCAPNGRNTYPVPGLMDKLVAQHGARLNYLGAVLASLEAEATAISDL